MWRTHGILLGILIAAILPLLILDRWLLAPKGGSMPLDLRGLLILPYLGWLLGHMILSTLLAYGWRTGGLLQIHGIAALLSAMLLGIGWWTVNYVDGVRGRAAHEAREAARTTLEATLDLQQWWFEPDANGPEAIHLIVTTEHSGRLAIRVAGLQAGEWEALLYGGEMKPQRWVTAGETVNVTVPLTHVLAGRPERIRFNLYLFPDQRGSAPDRIFKVDERSPESALPP
ncbi:MAG: hypothetical protein JJT88_09510 [Gammaproteobacteria bacterium]|nr:hypothetical protein [Gammaproteobacteria bacterium]